MIIDAVDTSDLSGNPLEDFIIFEQRLREALENEKKIDRQRHSDRDGYYTGSFSPERYYVSSMLAFLDSYDLEISVKNISAINDNEFQSHFNHFFNDINYARTTFMLRKQRMALGVAGTPVLIGQNYKDEIRKLLDTISKIVNQEVTDSNKKDTILKRIVALQLEVDRDQTTFDAFAGRMIDLSKALGECGNNIEPLVQKLERLKAIFWDSPERAPLLPQKERPKLISAKPENKSTNMDDEIPF